MATGDSPNPYSAPSIIPASTQSPTLPISEPDLKSIQVIIKDAGQFWLAIILCLLCSGIGSLIIGPWYISRLLQWSKLKNKYPALMDPAPPNTLPTNFQNAQWKLIVGITFGGIILLMVLLYIGLVIVVGAAGAARMQVNGPG
jgi:hypothetical protein